MPESNNNLFTSELKQQIKAIECNLPQNNSDITCHVSGESKYFYLLKNEISVPLNLSIKTTLKKEFQLTHYAGLQIIGDSAAFETSATHFLQKELVNKLKNFNGLILYGFTGEGANGIVSNLLNENLVSSQQVIANIVANESLAVIENYHCGYSAHIRNFLIVGDGKGHCQFGDDIELSDQLAEQLICLEGGVISFGQLINSLIYHQQPQITVYTHLRNQDETGFRPLFSAGELLLKFKSATCVHEIEEIFQAYLQNHRFNPKNNEENETKQKQIQEYFKKFKKLEKSIQTQILEKIKNVKHFSFQNENAKEIKEIATLFFKACESENKQIHQLDRTILTVN